MLNPKNSLRRRPWWNRPIGNDDITHVARITYRKGKKIVILVVGVTVILIGIVAIPFPVIPGWLVVFLGLAILAIEFAWARRWLRKLKRTANNSMAYVKGKVTGEKPTRPVEKSEPEEELLTSSSDAGRPDR